MIMDHKGGGATEAQQYVWGGAIPLQIHLHDSEVTTFPPPPPALVLAPRVGYLPLLAHQIKPFFSASLPPGVDTVWFEYKGLPLKWFVSCQLGLNNVYKGPEFLYIPTGVLFDLLCAEPERPWNLIIHFRGYPGNILTPCEGEDGVKWSYINALKEAAYIISGNCKNVMNLSQSDQTELWRSVLNGHLESYLRISLKLKLDIVGDDFFLKMNSSTPKSHQGYNNLEATGTTRTGRIPVRLYIRTVGEDINDLEDAHVDSWEKISYINRPVEIPGEGKCFTLFDALKALLPELFSVESSTSAPTCGTEDEEGQRTDGSSSRSLEETGEASSEGSLKEIPDGAEIKLVRIQGIEPQLEIPFGWVVKNLMNPEHYLHICVYVKVLQPMSI